MEIDGEVLGIMMAPGYILSKPASLRASMLQFWISILKSSTIHKLLVTKVMTLREGLQVPMREELLKWYDKRRQAWTMLGTCFGNGNVNTEIDSLGVIL